jgi:hypothetical protein
MEFPQAGRLHGGLMRLSVRLYLDKAATLSDTSRTGRKNRIVEKESNMRIHLVVSRAHSSCWSPVGKRRALALLMCLLMFAGNAFADFLVCTRTGVGSGTINGVPFSNAAFTITDTMDTSQRSAFNLSGNTGFSINDFAASITIAGVGNFNFTSGTRAFVNNTSGLVGFSTTDIPALDLFDGPSSSAFASWDMLSPIGPISGSGTLWPAWTWVTTDGGPLVFTYTPVVSTVFEANIVPEPGVGLLTMLGLACGWLNHRRRLR